ncbi:hypothetical protein [Rhodopila sp.]|uniref:hypothetical protein n=1 Tax=Rhodopila sp. TaxID=2480087 RepID=UPI003D136FAF
MRHFHTLAIAPLARVLARPPDVMIGGPDTPYLRRWWIIPRNRWCNLYLHHFLRSDDDRALHDHPWASLSILLRGRYREHLVTGPGKLTVRLRRPFRPILRRAVTAHRVALIDDQPVWTLFITGPRRREWGFLCPNGWRHWKAFTDPADPGAIGPGCG